MLTDEEKQKIKAEEIFREEIRGSIRPRPSKMERFTGFFKSSFGTWILTSILAFTVGFSFNYFRDRSETRKEKAELVRKLDQEIASRLLQYDYLLSSLITYLEQQATDNIDQQQRQVPSRIMQHFFQTGLYDAWLVVKSGRQGDVPLTILPSHDLKEYEGRSLPSLLFELKRILTNPAEIQEVDRILAFVLADGMFTSPQSRGMAVTIELASSLRTLLNQHVFIDRWKRNAPQ